MWLTVLPCAAVLLFPASATPFSDEIPQIPFEEATQLRSRGDYDGAVKILKDILSQFANSNQVLKRAYSELVFTYLQKGERELAEESAQQALYLFPEMEINTVYVAPVVQEVFDAMRQKMFGTLVVTTNPESCLVVFDGTFVGSSPQTIQHVRTGEHVLNLSKAGYYDRTRVVLIKPGKETQLDYTLLELTSGKTSGDVLRTGIGFGIGGTVPYGEIREQARLGYAFVGVGWMGVSRIPFALLRFTVAGQFLGAKDWGTLASTDTTQVEIHAKSSSLKITLGLDVGKRFKMFNPYVGTGGGIYFIWNSLDRLRKDGSINRESIFEGPSFGWNANLGTRLYISSNVALDFSAYYDRVFWIEQWNFLRSENRVEIRHSDYESVSVFASIILGRTPDPYRD